jgi:hypothetical protein
MKRQVQSLSEVSSQHIATAQNLVKFVLQGSLKDELSAQLTVLEKGQLLNRLEAKFKSFGRDAASQNAADPQMSMLSSIIGARKVLDKLIRKSESALPALGEGEAPEDSANPILHVDFSEHFKGLAEETTDAVKLITATLKKEAMEFTNQLSDLCHDYHVAGGSWKKELPNKPVMKDVVTVGAITIMTLHGDKIAKLCEKMKKARCGNKHISLTIHIAIGGYN